MNRRWIVNGVLAAACINAACEDAEESPDPLPTTPPTAVEMLTNTGFEHAGAVSASPDGQSFYTAAYDEQNRPGIFRITVADRQVTPVHVGAPLFYPSDLEVACDGQSIYVSDLGFGGTLADPIVGDFDDEAVDTSNAVFRLTTTGAIEPVPATGIGRAAGIVISTDCQSLHVTGFTPDEQPAVFRLPLAGGTAEVLYQGAPLVSPTGIHVDVNGVSWVMDHLAENASGQGLLFAINASGAISEVVGGLGMGRHGGVSLVPGGVTAVIPVADDFEGARLITANTVSGETTIIDTPDIDLPTGVAAARESPVMVVAGESSIHIATFE